MLLAPLPIKMSIISRCAALVATPPDAALALIRVLALPPLIGLRRLMSDAAYIFTRLQAQAPCIWMLLMLIAAAATLLMPPCHAAYAPCAF